MSSDSAPARTLLERTGRAAFWNAVLFPIKAVLGLAFGMIVARRFGLDAGVYHTAIGVVTTLLTVTGLGIANSLTKFLPEVDASAGAAAVVELLRRVALVRLAVLLVAVVALNVVAVPLAEWLDMGDQGVLMLRLATILVVARAIVDLAIRTSNAFFGQLRSNLIDVLQGVLDLSLAGLAVAAGMSIGGVFGFIVISGVIGAAIAIAAVRGILRGLAKPTDGPERESSDPAAARVAVHAESARFAGYALFTFVFELSIYCSGKSFANPALAVVLGRDDVAIFSYGFSLAFMTVGLMVASFRGLYRPMFAHLRTRNDPDQLRRAFAGITKAQLIILAPAAIGLTIMVADYIPLMYGPQFTRSIPVARVFVVLLYAQTAFNLGTIWLSIDERYRAVLWTQSIQVVAAPFFVVVAASSGLVAAAILFGGARVVTSVAGYAICHRDYGFRFPWHFAVKVVCVAGVMGGLLIGLRLVLAPSPQAAVGLTAFGLITYLLGLRVARVLGPEEIDLLQRSDVPGKQLAVAWLS